MTQTLYDFVISVNKIYHNWQMNKMYCSLQYSYLVVQTETKVPCKYTLI